MAGDRRAADPAQVSREQFDALFDSNFGRVLAYALRRVSDRSEAEDVVAETFAVAWRRRDEVPELEAPWLYGVAANVISNQRRADRRRLRLRGRIGGEPPRLGRDPAEAIGERDAIARAFCRLSESQREVLRLVSWEGLSPDDAAVALGCSHGAFRVRLHRARAALAKHLEEGGHEAGEGAAALPATEETT